MLTKYWPIILVLLFGFIASHRLLQIGYFSMQDDIHVFRLQQFDQCIHDRQIPCRLIPNGGLGYSYPLFNFYPPWPYIAAEIPHILGLSLINSLKISFVLPYFLGAIGMYLLSSSLFGTYGGLLSSVLYTFAPYQAVDGFVRGALAEHWALSLIPLVLYFAYHRRPYSFYLSLTLMLLSHNLSLVYFLPLLLTFSYLTSNSNFITRHLLYPMLLSAFFIIPAVFEKNLVTVDTMTQGYFNYINHFVTISQLFFSRFWGYGASLWGPVDDMSFQVGLIHWLVPLITLVTIRRQKHFRLILILFLVGLFSLFLTHNKSTFIWQMLPFLAYFQFPWRFLGLTIFCFSLLSGALSSNRYVVGLLILITLLLNFNYFKEDIWFLNMTDADKLTPSETYRQSGAGLMDYWTKYSTNYPTTMAGPPQVTTGKATIYSFSKSSSSANLSVNVSSSQAIIILPISYFPSWQIFIDGIKSKYFIDSTYGQISIPLSLGQHTIFLKFINTPIRTISNFLTVIGFCLICLKYYRDQQI